MGSYSVEPVKPWVETPCLYSPQVSRAAGCNIYLKLDNLQPSGSFKSRGIGNMMQRAIALTPRDDVHFYCPSGGNAGLACATSAASLGKPATIVVPIKTPAHMVEKLEALGAEVLRRGGSIAEADAYLKSQLLINDPNGVYVSPFDHPDIWEGASSIVDEITTQMRLQPGGPKEADGIVCNVGGGGLLIGIMDGLDRIYCGRPQNQPRVLAVETRGAESLDASIRAGELVTLPNITSICSSLGVARVAPRAYEWTKAAAGQLVTTVVDDADAVMGSVKFLDDARLLVEVACGATISVVYNGQLRQKLGKGLSDAEWAEKNIVLVVCGGSHTTLEALLRYREEFGV
ncbi:hypothetical protein MCOR27_008267 [Pyricularia oryzae]|uniref:L-serine ammonia-lyase n=2 Tax=Pyricularia TaxID=48558 RepID=A0ABQ8NDY3_PYRGI|nr:hypothetical protein MCOR01_006093 [Pyricularia oryzae]KAI6295480.1 hypothetical protein MCOR33_007629 [Pyricularia grisea]KAH9435397.1 hypothetical protein MCOR02_004336 [Pyricularia oryzae]KAI6259812.1 hypothetical protein MCOR19_003840 [Pyricularia oryzae]KAI6272591.1 hypothetical protein MCOR27_008267 [Pyricularia oryzae]